MNTARNPRITQALTWAISLAACSASNAASPPWMTANDDRISAIVSKMTLEEKVGQMTQPDLGAIKDFNDIQNLFLGSILSGGTSDPASGNTFKDWTNLYQDCQSRALKTRLAIPLLYGIDAVHGHNNVLNAVIFPHNIALGCTRNPALVEEAARITAAEVRATGIQWTFAPCVAVPQDIRWGRTYEGFSEDPALVTSLGAAAVRGLQGADLSAPSSAVGCAKHFVGDGGTTFGSATKEGLLDQGDTRVDEAALRSIHMAGYPAAIDAGVATIMPSYSSWNGVKCSGNKYLLTTVLKEELGFKGFLISDYNAIDQLVAPAESPAVESNNAAGQVTPTDYKKCIEISINAGMDMIMVTDRYREFIHSLCELVKEDRVPLSRIDDAVTRILRVKAACGLLNEKPELSPTPELAAQFGSPKHREVARKAVAESLVLLKNSSQVLPIKNNPRRIHLAGRGADDIGMQCGGWTIDWQGGLGKITPGGTTILEGIKQLASPLGTAVTYSADGSGAEGADLTIAVIGEPPYAEMKGDRADLAISAEDAALVANLKKSGMPVVVVVLSGRPLILGPVNDQADALVAAWLPGTEGAGVADVLFGKSPFSGRLSFSWPRTMEQLPHPKEKSETPLYPLGFGLTP